MRSYGQFCPVAVACQVFAERWTPLILRELLAGASRFNEIRNGMPLISRTLLAQRLRELEDTGVVESRPLPGGRGRTYHLTTAGEAFREVVDRLGEWGQRWGRWQFAPDNLEVSLLMWAMRNRVAVERLPERRVVARFEFRGVPPRWRNQRVYWLVLDRAEIDVCFTDPGFEVDLIVSADITAMGRVWTGHLTFAQAIRAGGMRIEGPRTLVAAFPSWFLLSPFAAVAPESLARRTEGTAVRP
jgi:DNA-binding HxlR family transcriptional regulator